MTADNEPTVAFRFTAGRTVGSVPDKKKPSGPLHDLIRMAFAGKGKARASLPFADGTRPADTFSAKDFSGVVIVHEADYAIKDDTRLRFTAQGGQIRWVTGERTGFLMTVGLKLVASNDKFCPAGRAGLVSFFDDKGQTFGPKRPSHDFVLLAVAGCPHLRYSSREGSKVVKVDIDVDCPTGGLSMRVPSARPEDEVCEKPEEPHAVLTVNGHTAEHRDVGYPPSDPAKRITFTFGTALRIQARATRPLPAGYHLIVFGEYLADSDKLPVFNGVAVLCHLKPGEERCPPIPPQTSTLPAGGAGGCQRISAEVVTATRRVSSAAVCLVPAA